MEPVVTEQQNGSEVPFKGLSDHTEAVLMEKLHRAGGLQCRQTGA